MPAWPTATLSTTYFDSPDDSPEDALPTLKATIEQINQIVAARGAIDGICPLNSARQIPTLHLPIGTGAGQVAAGDHTHPGLVGDSAAITALAALTPAANQLPYFTSDSLAAIATFTATGRAIVGSSDAAAARGVLGLGTAAVQAVGDFALTNHSHAFSQITSTPAAISTIAGLTPAADQIPYYTGASAAALTAFTTLGRSLAGAASAAAARTALGLGTAATYDASAFSAATPAWSNIQSVPAIIDAIDGLTPAADQIPYYTSPTAAAMTGLTATGRSIIGSTSATNARTALGLGSAATSQTTDFAAASHTQAFSTLTSVPAAISAITGLTPAADRIFYYTGAASAAIAVLTGFGRNFIAAADAAAALSVLGVTLGTSAPLNVGVSGGVQGYSAAGNAIAGLTPAADRLPYYTGATTASLANFTAFGRNLVAAADQTAAVSVLGIDTSVFISSQEAHQTFATAGMLQENIQVFSTAGSFTWAKPVNAKTVDIYLLAGSAGGGSGRRGATGTDCFGGGGAGATPMFTGLGFEADLFGATETGSVGAAGVGGAAITVDNTNGADGTDGGTTSFASKFQALGGKAGKGGTATSGLGGVRQFIAIGNNIGLNGFDATKGGDSGTTTTAGDGTTTGSATGAPYSITAVNGFFSAASGAGGSITAANVAHAGQAGTGIYNNTVYNNGLSAGAAGGANTGVAGTAGAVFNIGSHRKLTLGGGGGGANLSGAAGAGGLPGGGGGASRNGNNSGAGANGVVGWAIIVTHCG